MAPSQARSAELSGADPFDPGRGSRLAAPRWRERNKAIEASMKARAAAPHEPYKSQALVQILDGFGLDASLKVLGGCLVVARTATHT